MSYTVFHRTWWKRNPNWPEGREPGMGKRHFIAKAWSEEEARQLCREWNQSHDPGLLSDKAEYEENQKKKLPTTKKTMEKTLTLKQVLSMFDGRVQGDVIATQENWNNFTDRLCKDGEITLKQYENWNNLFDFFR